MINELPDYLPLSYLNQLAYCERRFWLMYIQSEMEINAPVQEGIYQHGRAHVPGVQTDELGRVLRSIHVWSDHLHIAGIADFVQEREGELIPLEHKHGKMGNWLNDHIQLCAQALCLEERTGRMLERGEIFYWKNRRRERVALDEPLRARTVEAINRAFELLRAGRFPPPLDHPGKCRDCSLEAICLPRETLKMIEEDQRG